MLACAQESIYTKAKTGKMKQKTLAQVCQQCHGLYADVAKCAERLSKVPHCISPRFDLKNDLFRIF